MNNNMRTIYPTKRRVSDISIVEQKKVTRMKDHVMRVVQARFTKEQLMSGHYDQEDIIKRYEDTGVMPVGRQHEDYFELFDRKKQLELQLAIQKSDYEQQLELQKKALEEQERAKALEEYERVKAEVKAKEDTTE